MSSNRRTGRTTVASRYGSRTNLNVKVLDFVKFLNSDSALNRRAF